MKTKVAFYGNNSRLGKFILEKWCIKNHKKYKIYLIFDNISDSNSFTKIPIAETIILLNNDLIKTLCEKNIHDIFLLDPSKLLENSYKKESFSKNNISIYIENSDFLKTHFDKYLSNLCLKKTKLPIPKFQLLSEFISKPTLDFPIIVKPTRGYASKGIKIFNTRCEFDKDLDKNILQKKFIVQEFLKGKEYSCTVVRNVNLEYMSIQRQSIKEYTISSQFKKKYNNHLNKWMSSISDLGFEYALNIQYILTKSGPKIFEINPRLGTAECHRFEYLFDSIDFLLTAITEPIKFREGNFALKIVK